MSPKKCNAITLKSSQFCFQYCNDKHVWCDTYTFQACAPECDLSVPPAIASCAAPHCRAVLLSFLHKHLQHSHMVSCQLVAKRQAQIAVVPRRCEWEDQSGPSSGSFVSYLWYGEVPSTCRDEQQFTVFWWTQCVIYTHCGTDRKTTGRHKGHKSTYPGRNWPVFTMMIAVENLLQRLRVSYINTHHCTP